MVQQVFPNPCRLRQRKIVPQALQVRADVVGIQKTVDVYVALYSPFCFTCSHFYVIIIKKTLGGTENGFQ